MSTPQSGERAPRFWRVLYALLSLEIGAFLAFAPWASVWEERLLFGYLLPFRHFLLNYYVRGGVSGLGLVNLWLGFTQARALRQAVSHNEPAE